MDDFTCIPPCNQSFLASGPFTKHQNRCKVWNGHNNQASGSRRAAASLRSKTAREKLHLARTTTVSQALCTLWYLQLIMTRVQPEPPQAHLDGGDVPMVVDPPMDSAEPVPHPVADPNLPAETSRPKRSRRLPARFCDALPVPPTPIAIPAPNPEPTRSRIKRLTLIVRDRFITAANIFGIWRDYPHRPSYDPDTLINSEDLSNRDTPPTTNLIPPSIPTPSPPWPFANMTIWRIMKWFNSGSSMKTEAEVNRLVKEIHSACGFPDSDLEGFDVRRETKRLDVAQMLRPFADGFQETNLKISVPSGDPDVSPQEFTVPGLQFRSITSVIKAAFESPLADHFHLSPYRLFRKSPTTNEEQRIYSELYDSDAFIEVHDDVQRHGLLPPDDLGCALEKVVAALMFWSDSTHLTDFGTAKIWPIYLLFGNLSKYIRMRPTSGACHHLAYIPTVCAHHHPIDRCHVN